MCLPVSASRFGSMVAFSALISEVWICVYRFMDLGLVVPFLNMVLCMDVSKPLCEYCFGMCNSYSVCSTVCSLCMANIVSISTLLLIHVTLRVLILVCSLLSVSSSASVLILTTILCLQACIASYF